MPFAQDIVTRIINVQWGGATFVYGTLLDNALYYVGVGVASNRDIHQQTIVAPGPGNPDFGLSAYGSSFGFYTQNEGLPNEVRTPVFLVCGNKAGRIDATDNAGNPVSMIAFYTMIYYSNDGLNWTIVRQQAGTPTWDNQIPGARPAALVVDKDKKAFFYDQHFDGNDQIFQSSNGAGWAMISSTPTKDAGDSYQSEFLKHCANNDCLDALGQHVPDGVMANTFVAKPVLPPIINYVTGSSSVSSISDGETWGSDQIEIKEFDDDGKPLEPRVVSVPGLKKVFCVAAANGILMAGGAADVAGDTGAVVLSFDQGKTWQVIADRASSVTTMVARPG